MHTFLFRNSRPSINGALAAGSPGGERGGAKPFSRLQTCSNKQFVRIESVRPHARFGGDNKSTPRNPSEVRQKSATGTSFVSAALLMYVA